jgi:hypothetical protein
MQARQKIQESGGRRLRDGTLCRRLGGMTKTATLCQTIEIQVMKIE